MNRVGRNRGGILKVLLIVFGVIFLCLAVATVYIGLHWKEWVAGAANVAARRAVAESGLTSEQKDSILTEIEQLGNDFKEGKVGTEDLARIANALRESPLIPLAGVEMVRQRYIDPSGMTEEERADAILSVQRLARGVYEKKISTASLTDVAKPVADLRPNGQWRPKEHPTRMEIDQFVANAKASADAAMIPDEPFELDYAEEIRKVIHFGWK